MLHDSFEAVVEGRDVLLFVMERDDDGVFQHLLMIRVLVEVDEIVTMSDA